MRTSRISKDTARVANVLTTPRRAAAQQALRRFANADPASTASSPNTSASEHSEPLSSPEASEDNEIGSTRKRKRVGTATPATSVSIESESVRRSPRKAPKIEEDGASSTKRKARRQPAKKVKTENGDVQVDAPPNWEQMYSITAEMRKHVLAPVDTMGCESLAEEHRSPLDRRLQTLVALMLSSQTKDTVTAVAMKQLQEGLPGGFNLEALLQVAPTDLNSLINKVGFHNNKTKFIKQVAVILKEKFNGDIPDTIEGLVSLPGVGPKMAYLTMSAAWGRDEGIGVDVHVHRITNLWGWHKTANPEQTRAELESWLPKDKWHDINHLLVGFGQTICLPVGRRCDDCELSKQKLCPSAVAGSPKKKKVKKETIEIKVEGDAIVKEEATVEADDAAAVMKIKSEDLGEVQMQIGMSNIEDIAQ
ncbi:putative endonuclease III-like protein [Septoria linicola]|nr:putative endonuclease III-like protein [Septoria linicola]